MSIRFKCDKFEMGIKALDKLSSIQEKGFLRKLCFFQYIDKISMHFTLPLA